MAITQHQLDNFHQFATQKLSTNGADLSWPELFDLWRLENPTVDQQARVYEALDESLEDIENGLHRPANDVVRDVRVKHNLP